MSAVIAPSQAVIPSPVPREIEPDDLLKMERDGLFELADGRLIEKNMGFGAGDTATNVISLIHSFSTKHDLGKLVPEISFRCFPRKPKQVRRPDLAFIVTARLAQVPKEGHVPIAPDLVIEIVSPGDNVYVLDRRISDYRSVAVPMIWILNPDARMVRVYRMGSPIEELTEADELRGDPVLPGFSVKVSELFPQT